MNLFLFVLVAFIATASTQKEGPSDGTPWHLDFEREDGLPNIAVANVYVFIFNLCGIISDQNEVPLDVPQQPQIHDDNVYARQLLLPPSFPQYGQQFPEHGMDPQFDHQYYPENVVDLPPYDQQYPENRVDFPQYDHPYSMYRSSF